MNDDTIVNQLKIKIQCDKDEFESLLDAYPELPGNDFEFNMGHVLVLKGIGQFVSNLSAENFNEMVNGFIENYRPKRQNTKGLPFTHEALEPVIEKGLEREMENLNVPYPIEYELKITGWLLLNSLLN